jgi:hypothetical protein
MEETASCAEKAKNTTASGCFVYLSSEWFQLNLFNSME